MGTHLPTVVVGVDGSAPAAEAARAAAREADRRRMPLRLVRAFHWPSGDVPGLPDAQAACGASRRSAIADLDRLRHSLEDLLPGRMIRAELLDGRPDAVLCQATQAEDLLVIGANGLTWGCGAMLGSVAESVAATAACPVLVHRPLAALGPRHCGVVAGVDCAGGSTAVLAAAVTEAQLRHEPLQVVHAWRQLTEDAVHALRWRLDADTSTSAETAAVEPLVAEVRQRHPDLPVEVAVRPGRAGQVLVQAARSATLLVVGRRDITAGGPGATVHSVLHRADVPVLTVPVPAAVPGASAGRTVGAVAAGARGV